MTFKLKSGNKPGFKQMGSSPVKDMKTGSYEHSFESPAKQKVNKGGEAQDQNKIFNNKGEHVGNWVGNKKVMFTQEQIEDVKGVTTNIKMPKAHVDPPRQKTHGAGDTGNWEPHQFRTKKKKSPAKQYKKPTGPRAEKKPFDYKKQSEKIKAMASGIKADDAYIRSGIPSPKAGYLGEKGRHKRKSDTIKDRPQPTWPGTDEYRKPKDIPASEYKERGIKKSPLKQDYIGNVYHPKWNPSGTVDFEGKRVNKAKGVRKGASPRKMDPAVKPKKMATDFNYENKKAQRQTLKKVVKKSAKKGLGKTILKGAVRYAKGGGAALMAYDVLKHGIKNVKEGKAKIPKGYYEKGGKGYQKRDYSKKKK